MRTSAPAAAATSRSCATPAQLKLKENHLAQSLARIGGQDVSAIKVSPIVPSVDAYCYRGKIELSFGEEGGRPVAGLAGRSSPLSPYAGRIVPIGGCDLFSPVAARLLPLVMEAVHRAGLTAYNDETGAGALKRLVIREAKGTREVMLHVVAASDVMRALAPLEKRLGAEVPQVVSAYATSGSATRLLWGAPAIEERLSGLSFRISPPTFFQPNPMAAALLYERIANFARDVNARRVLGLYCGSGAIEVFMARRLPEIDVTGVDSSEANIACAQENAAVNGAARCRFIRDMAEERRALRRGRRTCS